MIFPEQWPLPSVSDLGFPLVLLWFFWVAFVILQLQSISLCFYVVITINFVFPLITRPLRSQPGRVHQGMPKTLGWSLVTGRDLTMDPFSERMTRQSTVQPGVWAVGICRVLSADSCACSQKITSPRLVECLHPFIEGRQGVGAGEPNLSVLPTVVCNSALLACGFEESVLGFNVKFDTS